MFASSWSCFPVLHVTAPTSKVLGTDEPAEARTREPRPCADAGSGAWRFPRQSAGALQSRRGHLWGRGHLWALDSEGKRAGGDSESLPPHRTPVASKAKPRGHKDVLKGCIFIPFTVKIALVLQETLDTY